MIDFEGEMKYNICRLAIANHQKTTNRYRRKALAMNLREAQDGKLTKIPRAYGVVFLRTQCQLYSPAASYIASQ